jgi:Carboxylesterase family
VDRRALFGREQRRRGDDRSSRFCGHSRRNSLNPKWARSCSRHPQPPSQPEGVPGALTQQGALGTNRFRLRDTNDIAGPSSGDEIRQQYPPGAYDSRMWANVAALSDAVYTCPMRRLGLTTSGPVWRYLYTHTYENDEFFGAFRAGHFLDEPLLWHDVDLLSGFGQPPYELTPDEEALSAKMSTYWANFAKTGDPNGGGLDAWPSFDSVDAPIMTLGGDEGVIHAYHRDECSVMVRSPPCSRIHGAGPGVSPSGSHRAASVRSTVAAYPKDCTSVSRSVLPRLSRLDLPRLAPWLVNGLQLPRLPSTPGVAAGGGLTPGGPVVNVPLWTAMKKGLRW